MYSLLGQVRKDREAQIHESCWAEHFADMDFKVRDIVSAGTLRENLVSTVTLRENIVSTGILKKTLYPQAHSKKTLYPQAQLEKTLYHQTHSEKLQTVWNRIKGRNNLCGMGSWQKLDCPVGDNRDTSQLGLALSQQYEHPKESCSSEPWAAAFQ